MRVSVSSLNKERVDLEQEIFNLKKLYNPNLELEEIRNSLNILTERKNQIETQIKNFRKKLESLESDSSYKSFLEQIYYDLKQMEKSLENTYKNLFSKLKVNFQKKELFGNSHSIKIEKNDTSLYDQYEETKELTNNASLKADQIIDSGNSILAMFDKQRSSLQRTLGNLNIINSDAKFSDYTTGKIVERLKNDKKLVFALTLLTIFIIFGLYYLLKIR
jgi:hypothetical protein